MIDNLKTKLANNYSPQAIIKQLSRPALVHSLTSTHLEQLCKIVEGKVVNYKLHMKVCLTIYSIIIMKGYKNYNTKMAIESLTKYYKSLQQKNNEQNLNNNQNNVEEDHYSKTKKVIANLLIRIPTFSNYKLIIKDLHPYLLPISVIYQHKNQIMKQCPNLYKQILIKSHKHVWYQLLQNDQQNYPLHKQFSLINQHLVRLGNSTDWLELAENYEEINKNLEFIRNRIEKVSSNRQELDIQNIEKKISSILLFNVPLTQQRRLLPFDITNRQSIYIRNTKSSSLQIFRLLLTKIHFNFIRKLSWLSQLVQQLIYRPYDCYSIEPAYLIDFVRTVLELYGIGCYSFDKIVHDESISCLSKLIMALCYNNYDNNNKKQESQINYQTQSKNKNKASSTIHINLFNTTEVDTSYQYYLKSTTASQRDILLNKILLFLIQYYRIKSKCGMQYFHSAQIFGTLANSKNKISNANNLLINQIKSSILYKGYERIGEGIDLFCQNVFNQYIKKKKNPRLQINRTQQIIIKPTKPQDIAEEDKGSQLASFANLSMQRNLSNQTNNYTQGANLNSIRNRQDNSSQLRKTNSFDLQLQGWNNQKVSINKSSQKSALQKSQMFYSIKQCSVIEQKDQQVHNNKSLQKKQQQEEHQFILTPEF